MASSGIRLGAWGYLTYGHIRQIEKEKKKREREAIAAKIVVYAEFTVCHLLFDCSYG